jgi:heme-degrading monooxygenase HmoA
MSIIRMIYVTVDRSQLRSAEQIWKEHCAPLMITQPGCLSEKLLICLDNPGEVISYSEWEDETSIERYRNSAAHEEIRKHTRTLVGGRPVVKKYDLGAGAK